MTTQIKIIFKATDSAQTIQMKQRMIQRVLRYCWETNDTFDSEIGFFNRDIWNIVQSVTTDLESTDDQLNGHRSQLLDTITNMGSQLDMYSFLRMEKLAHDIDHFVKIAANYEHSCPLIGYMVGEDLSAESYKDAVNILVDFYGYYDLNRSSLKSILHQFVRYSKRIKDIYDMVFANAEIYHRGLAMSAFKSGPIWLNHMHTCPDILNHLDTAAGLVNNEDENYLFANYEATIGMYRILRLQSLNDFEFLLTRIINTFNEDYM